ncbi:Xaa-Pro dipeptidase [Porticoccaceae bacterium]|nr:Xaa-Pro dipeptidase [Porticoccaceae bacterium]
MSEHHTLLAENLLISKSYTKHFSYLREVYDRALLNSNFESLVVYSGEIKKRFQDDIQCPFFVNVQFKALVPLTDVPESWLIWRLSEKPLLLLYQPETVWDSVVEVPSTFWSSYFEIIPIKKKGDAQSYIDKAPRRAFLGEHTELTQSWDLGANNPESLVHQLNWHRSYKTDYEQLCVKKANCISAKGHVAARDAFYEGASEFDIALAFQKACRQTEEQLAFSSTIAINEHAAILHYWGRDKRQLPIDKRHSFLIDAGATYNGYAADTCRTYAYRDGLFADMVAALDSVQQEIISQLKVGLSYVDSAERAARQLATLLKDFGIVNLDPDSAIELGLIKYFMPHNVSHFLGLQVHDVGGNQLDITGAMIDPEQPKYKMKRTIDANQILTVEPGIYFIDSLLKPLSQSEHRSVIDWDRIESLKPYGGMRIEDNILITAEGPVNFTREAFTELAT